jgi:UDP-glucose 4-epimerase
MKILVTGGAGFIGSHTVDALLAEKHRVFVVDNLSTGFRKNVNPKAVFQKADFADFKKVEVLLKKIKPDAIFHLAAQMDVRKSVEDPLFDAKNNILVSFNLIRLAQKYNVKKFVFSSTGGATYGDTDLRPTSETFREVPLSPYGIAKMTVDRFLEYCRLVHNFNYTSLRYANVYGPRQNPHGEAGVVAIFLNKMLANEQPTINGSGKQTRDYIFVKDVVRANLLALKNLRKTGVFNVGTGIETDVNKLFHAINENFQNRFKEAHGPAKQGEQMTSCLDFSKIKKEFGWTPKTKFADGIRKTYDWFLKNKLRKQ